MALTYVCSPLSAPTRAEMLANAAKASTYMMKAEQEFGNRAVAPHAYLPFLLDDTAPEERALALEFGQKLLAMCTRLVVYGDRISSGMSAEIMKAEELGIPVLQRPGLLIEEAPKPVIVGRCINGVTINGLEYLQNDDGEVLYFKGITAAKDYLREHEVTDEEMRTSSCVRVSGPVFAVAIHCFRATSPGMLTSASNAMKTSMPSSKAEIRDDRKEDLFMEINRGDVFYVNRSETIGSEQRSGRPAIIVSNPECNEHSPVVEVVYLTCQYKKPMPTHVRIESIGRRSTALCEQITSVDVSRLGDYKGHLTEKEMEQVDVALMQSLGIHPLTQQAKVEPVGPSVDDAALAMIALRFLEGFLQKRCGVEISGSICSGLLGQKQR